MFRRFWSAWARCDLSAALELVDPDVVVRPLFRVLYSSDEYRGCAGLAQWHAEMTDPWDRFDITVEAVQPTSEGVLGVLGLAAHRGAEVLSARVAIECELRDGRILAMRSRDAEEALEDAAEGR